MKRSLLRLSLASALAFTTALSAQAQDSGDEDFFARDRYTAVTERAQPDFDPEPVRIGTFQVRPVLSTGIAYQTNIFAASEDETGDTIFTFAPSFDARSDWSRHEIALSGNVAHREYLDTGSESATDYGVRAAGRADVTSRFNFDGAVSAERTVEPRYATASLPTAAEPTELDRVGAEAGAEFESGRLQLRGRLQYDQYDYSDVPLVAGGTADQDFRDVDQTSGSVRAAIAVERDWAVFAEARVIDRTYDTPAYPGAPSRDSTGTVYQVGTDFELSSLMRGQVAVGYLKTDFDDTAFADVDGISVDARVQWFLTQLTNITASATRTVVDPGLTNAAGATYTGADVRVDHELRRNWLVYVEGGLASIDFQDFDRTDDRYTAGLGTLWKLNKRAWLQASYRFTTQESDFQDFTDNRFGIELKLFP